MSKRSLPRVLTIAGSDSSGGAGIQADLKTFQALWCYGMSVTTVLTAQNTVGVTSVSPVSNELIEAQIAAVLDDIGVDVIKIGMLFSQEIIEVVASSLKKYKVDKIVVDPVMVAKGGQRLLKSDAVEAYRELILPLASVLTPNIPEAEVLLNQSIKTIGDVEKAAYQLAQETRSHVVLKGGHLDNATLSPDFYTNGNCDDVWFEYSRIETKNTHGTGCTYSSAIAAFAATGLNWKESVSSARRYLQSAIESGAKFEIGKGNGPVDHGWMQRK